MDLIQTMERNIEFAMYVCVAATLLFVAWKLHNKKNRRERGFTQTTAEETNRIKFIPHTDKGPFAEPPNWGAIAGVLCFFAGGMPFLLGFNLLLFSFLGIGLTICVLSKTMYGKNNWPATVFTVGVATEAVLASIILKSHGRMIHGHPAVWIGLMAAGLLIALISLLLHGRRIRRDWIRVEAKCIDREIYEDFSYTDGEDTKKVWYFRLLCEFELNGRQYRVTPNFWRSFATKRGISNFLENNISSDGMCELHVNPSNPLQTEFAGHDIKDALLH